MSDVIAIIDGDLVSYRNAASAEDAPEAWIALARCDNFIEEILAATNTDTYEIWLSGKNNFRYQVYPEYKAKRKEIARPKWESDAKEYLKLHHNAQIIDNAEADDALGFRQYELLSEGKTPICCTNDKDNKQTEGLHYDPVKKQFFTVKPEEALRWFYYQMLVGDPVDNIKGARGIGPKKAEAILKQAEEDAAIDEAEDLERYYREAVMLEYSCEEEFDLNAKCLYIWKKRGDIWQS